MQRLAQRGSQKSVPCDVDAITGREQQVIHQSFRAVAEPESQAGASTRCGRGRDATPWRDGNRRQTMYQPGRAGRTDRTPCQEILDRAWRPPVEARPCDQPADEAWAHDVEWGPSDRTEDTPGCAAEAARFHVRKHVRP